jgi:hypothetical protein
MAKRFAVPLAIEVCRTSLLTRSMPLTAKVHLAGLAQADTSVLDVVA